MQCLAPGSTPTSCRRCRTPASARSGCCATQTPVATRERGRGWVLDSCVLSRSSVTHTFSLYTARRSGHQHGATPMQDAIVETRPLSPYHGSVGHDQNSEGEQDEGHEEHQIASDLRRVGGWAPGGALSRPWPGPISMPVIGQPWSHSSAPSRTASVPMHGNGPEPPACHPNQIASSTAVPR